MLTIYGHTWMGSQRTSESQCCSASVRAPQPRECGGDQEWPAWLCFLRHVQSIVIDSAQSLRTWRTYVLSLGTMRWVGWFRGQDRGSGTRSSHDRCFMK